MILTYTKIQRDPTQKYKKQLVGILSNLKEKGELNENLYRQIYPTTESPPKFYGLPKIHKANTPLRPIVSSIDSITYNCAKYLAEILAPLAGKTEHHIKNSQHLSEIIKTLHIEDDEILHSYDVSALFTSVPVDKALVVISERLRTDTTLHARTTLSPDSIVQLLSECLNCTYFCFNEQFYVQIHGAAMGSPVSPLICNLYMEAFEQRAISTASNPPGWWFRYVDDTHLKQKQEHLDQFTEHINSIDPDIKFTSEPENNGTLPFLDTLTHRKEDGSLKVSIYRKPTHTDQYLNFESNHPLEHKLGVVKTLHHRADCVVTDQCDLISEREHINTALKACGYPDWSIQKALSKTRNNKSSDKSSVNNRRRGFVTIPYISGLTEPLRRVLKNYGISSCVKPTNTLRQLLCSPKDKSKKELVTGPIYHIKCEGNNCDAVYIGESERTLKTRFQEHKRPSNTNSEVCKHIHQDCPSHTVSLDSTKLLDKEPKWFERGVKEAIYIRAHKPSLNRDGGRHQLPHIWDGVITAHVGSFDTTPTGH